MNTREIKFRVYNTKTKQWVHGPNYEVNLFGECILLGGFMNKIPVLELNDCVPLQYTGIKDCNGVEIYEGDILNCDLVGGDDAQTVIFKDGIFTLDYLTPGCYNLHDEITQMVGHRVIGNIFENTDLLK